MLKGQVSKQNTKYNTGNIEYIKDAFVSAPFTKPNDTDVQGRFELEFVGLDAGTEVELQVEKDGLDVVNLYDQE